MLERLRASWSRFQELNERVREGFAAFTHLEVSGSVVLLVATVVALTLANSPAQAWFDSVWQTEIGLRVGAVEFTRSVLHWIDDGLMAIFFFVVGLEIKREFIAGELSTSRKAALPIIAAAGGMLVPALIYLAFNRGGASAAGWGVPMATDIAFALGVMTLLGDRVPVSLKVFMAALAIADDIGAVLVIALFYTSEILLPWLAVGVGLLLLLLVLNRARVDSPVPYLIVAVGVWFCFLNSGIHATVAGVLVAFTIPARVRMEPMAFVSWARRKLDEIETLEVPGANALETPEQQRCAQELQAQARWTQAPLQRAEAALHPLSTFVVLPLFALANAGIVFAGVVRPLSTAALGVFLGLVVGKPVGIVLFTWLARRSGIADLPEGVGWPEIVGAGCLGGIGFTMSFFISGLAFGGGDLQDQARLATLVASTAAGIIGYGVLRAFAGRRGVAVPER